MSKIINKKDHKLRRFFIGMAIATAVAVAGVIGVTAFLPIPNMLLSGIGLLVAGICAGITIGVGVNYANQVRVSKASKSASLKTMEKIAEADKDPANTYTAKQKTKMVKTLAKANLKLCKIDGCPICGKYSYLGEGGSVKSNEEFNRIDNYDMLSKVGDKKQDKKLQKITQKRNLPASAVKSNLQRWTMSYDNFIEGAQIYDRRTEIACFKDSTVHNFESIAKKQPVTKDVGGVVIVSLNGDTKQTYARVTDLSVLGNVSNLMLRDVYDRCLEKTESEAENMFPIKVSKYVFDKNANAKDEGRPIEIDSLSKLKDILGVSSEVEK